MAISLMKSDVRRLHRILSNLLTQSEADGCVICDQAGYVMHQVGVNSFDPNLISALGAGVFAATRELAGIIGENEFNCVLHQGEHKSILISAASEDALLAVIYSSGANTGLVKFYTPSAAAAVRSVLNDVRRENSTVPSETQSFVLTDNDNVFRPA